MKLTSEVVEKIFLDCLFKEDEDHKAFIEARGVQLNVGFHPGRLKENESKIIELLDQLPDNFKESKGGGWSFLNACIDKDDNQWGEHRNIDQLLCLGIGIGKARILLPREMWSIFPGGIPYFTIKQ